MPELASAYLKVETGEEIHCLYNPESVSVSRSNTWTSREMPGKGVSTLEFTGSGGGKMSLALVFDTTATGKSVNEHTDKILKLMEVDPNLPAATRPGSSDGRRR